ncbi:uncharacterized protein LOC134692311 [Mytilus trossulus]|uniref:uncharacterized protein LOC134692311 n=1 Tax=Mytilus trossulus TaxID=6551 RepID=UPI0030074E7F
MVYMLIYHELRNDQVKFAKQIEKWKEDDKSFKSTNGSNAVLKSIQEQPSVAITGSFGVGKTAILYHVAIEMCSKGYIVVPIGGPLEVQKYNHPVEKNLFIVDNFCDECDLDEEEVEAWNNCNVEFDEKCKLLVSCKLQVYRSMKHAKLENISFHECNLLSNVLCLSREERQTIAKEKYGIDIADIDEYIELYNCFPLLCQYFIKSNNNVNERAFFENPFEVFETQFKMLQEVFAYGKVSALMTLLMFDDNVREVMILGDINADDKDILLNTSKACKLNSANVYNTIHRELESLIDTYLVKREGIYHALNERILNFLIRYFGKQMTELLIQHSCRSFFQTRLQLSDPSKEKQDYELSKTVGKSEKKTEYTYHETWDKVGQNVVVLESEEYRKLYVNRMFTDWSKGYVKDAFKNPNFVHVFSFKYLEKKDKDELKQLTEITDLTDGSTPLIAYFDDRTYTHSPSENVYDIAFHWLIDFGCSVNKPNVNGETALFLAVSNGTVDVVKLLLDNEADSNICTNEGYSPLYKACEKDNNEVVNLLLSSGADCNKCSKNGDSPLHAACSGGYISIVNNLLKNNADVNIRNKEGYTPLDVARLNDHQDIINESCNS